jgi:hypothetical protein
MSTSGDEPEISILDARLAEIDRRLHSIQTDLVADELPPRVAVPGDHPRAADRPRAVAPAPPSTADELVARLRELTAAQEGVLSSLRQLLASGGQRPAGRLSTARDASAVNVSAGPFASTEGLRAFRTALETLPGVRSVELRGFAGEDRAILDVHL